MKSMKKLKLLSIALIAFITLIIFSNENFAANTMNLNITDKRPYTQKNTQYKHQMVM